MFLVFVGEIYYPSGGWKDFHSFHNSKDSWIKTVKELMSLNKDNKILYDWIQVVNLENKTVKLFEFNGDKWTKKLLTI